ncbi:MAG: serine/threonine protein kinase, partial [Eggerthellaceae bacterium]|nr:serine/threonine protein kinase [Eggerthellaceae bacterium]
PAPEPVTALAHLPGLDEARTAAKLADTRIVTVFDFEVRGNTAYLIMEYVEGVTLTRFLAENGDRLTLDMAAAIFDAIAGALTVAHKAGVLHLDIKPDNIIINPQGQAKVTDFGLATLADASGAGTTGGGTIGYMPLEQMRRQPLDARTDEWSLASLTYEMLTGENPFRARTLDDAERAIENAELVLPSLCWEAIDGQVDDVIFYALDPDPAERYASVADFAEEMDKFLGDADAGKRQLAALVGGAVPDEHEDEDDYAEAPARRTREPRKRPAWLGALARRAFAALTCGLLAWYSLANMQLVADLFGGNTPFAIAAISIVVAALGAIRAQAGALFAYVLLGASLIVASHPVEGVTVIAAGILCPIAAKSKRWLAAVVLAAGIAVLVVGTCFLTPPSPQPVSAALLAAAVLASVVLSE